jgi:hypothetical protein
MNLMSHFKLLGRRSPPAMLRLATLVIRPVMVMTCLATCCLMAPCLGMRVARAADRSAGDEWVERGRDAFGSELKSAPWYDSKSDSLRPIDVAPAEEEAEVAEKGWSGLDWAGALLKIGAYSVLATILIGLAWMLIRAYLERERSAVKSSKAINSLATADRIEALPFALEGKMDDLLAAARRLYAEGKYSEAIVYLFSHELVELDRHQHIRLAKGKTNRQYLRELAGKADLKSLLSITIDRFERAFFGAERLDRASLDACWNELARFAALVAKEPA